MLVLPPPPPPPLLPLSLVLFCFIFSSFFLTASCGREDVMYNRKKYSILKIVNILSAEFIFELLE